MRFPVAPLLARVDSEILADALGFQPRSVARRVSRGNGLRPEEADRWACSVGLTPWEVWPEEWRAWSDKVTAAITEEYDRLQADDEARRIERVERKRAYNREYQRRRREDAAAREADAERKRQERRENPALARAVARAAYRRYRDTITANRRRRYAERTAEAERQYQRDRYQQRRAS